MPVQMDTSILEFESGRSHSVSHHRTQVRTAGGHLVHHKTPVCAVDDRVLPASKTEGVQEPPESTQQELLKRTSQAAGLSKTVGFFRTRLRCNVEGKWSVTVCKEFTQPKPVGGIQVTESNDWTSSTWSSRSGRMRLRGSRSQVREPSSCAWACQTSDFAPEMEGMDAVSVSGGTAVGQAKPEDPDLCIGGPTAVQLPSVYGETRRNLCEIHFGHDTSQIRVPFPRC